MPLYDFQCLRCNKEFEDFVSLRFLDRMRCPECKAKVKVVIKQANKDWFTPHINDDFTGEPIEVTSRKHLRELCKQHNCYSRALD